MGNNQSSDLSNPHIYDVASLETWRGALPSNQPYSLRTRRQGNLQDVPELRTEEGRNSERGCFGALPERPRRRWPQTVNSSVACDSIPQSTSMCFSASWAIISRGRKRSSITLSSKATSEKWHAWCVRPKEGRRYKLAAELIWYGYSCLVCYAWTYIKFQ